MAIRIERLTAESLPAVRALRESQGNGSWPDDLADRFYRWRYLAREDAETLVAMDGDRCVAMLDSLCHDYRLGSKIVAVREPCEWFCVADYRPQGLGLKLMRGFMKRPEPMFAMAGTSMTQDILPLLGWQALPETVNFTLPLTTGAFADSLLGRLRFPRGRLRSGTVRSLSFPLWRRKAQAPAGNRRVSELAVDEELPGIDPCPDYGLACKSSGWEPAWLRRAPTEMGRFSWLVAYSGEQAIGFSVSRVFQNNGIVEAKLLHLQSSQNSIEFYEWLVVATARFLARAGAVKVTARASCPTFADALTRSGFVARSRTPAFWWCEDGSLPSAPLHLTLWRADEAIRPYPPR